MVTIISCFNFQRSIMKILQQDGKSKLKFSKAKTFCANRLTDLRSEERRRVYMLDRAILKFNIRSLTLFCRYLETSHVKILLH